jgi:hypothetical protein
MGPGLRLPSHRHHRHHRQRLAGRRLPGDLQFTHNNPGWMLEIQDADTFTSSYVFDAAGQE